MVQEMKKMLPWMGKKSRKRPELFQFSMKVERKNVFLAIPTSICVHYSSTTRTNRGGLYERISANQKYFTHTHHIFTPNLSCEIEIDRFSMEIETKMLQEAFECSKETEKKSLLKRNQTCKLWTHPAII